MDPQPTATTADPTLDTAQTKKHALKTGFDRMAKKPPTRSNEASTADYLLDQNRIGKWNHQPYRKRRYVKLRLAEMMTSLITLYSLLFQSNWHHFSRALDKWTLPTGMTSHMTLCARTYLSHWLYDLYYHIRQSLKKVDPVAFIERYSVETAYFAETYDHYLALLASAIKPTYITGATADEIYIPIMDENLALEDKNPFPAFKEFNFDMTLFHLIHGILIQRKIVKMTPVSDEPLGRPSWLFDWPAHNQAYAWFPMEGNYNDTDIAIAYIAGVPLTPKLGFADIDEWRYYEKDLIDGALSTSTYVRTTKQRWRGVAQYRLLQIEKVAYPTTSTEKDKDKEKQAPALTGPLQLYPKDGTYDPPSSSSSTEEPTAEDTVPESPRIRTRSQLKELDKNLVYRSRVIDYIYYSQVISRADDATRFAAFKKFTNAD